MANKPDFPLSFSGEVWFISPTSDPHQKVFLVLDTDLAVFKHYNKRSNHIDDLSADFQILIKEIRTVCHSIQDDGKQVFTVTGKDMNLAYYCEFADMSMEWYSKILASINYFHLYSSDTDSRATRPNEEERKTIRSEFSDFSEDAASSSDPAVCEDWFENVEEVGAGAFGKVWKVIKRDTGEVYAIKKLKKSTLKNRNQLKYALSECKTLKSLRHPFIIPLEWSFQTSTHINIVMEYCPFGDFTRIMEQFKKLDELVARFYICEVILAIEYLHSLNIIYRDLKPQNVLIDRTGHIKLADFSLAKENVTQENPAMSFCGTSLYMPPEVLAGSGTYKSADIYLIGVNLYEMICGKPPFVSKDLATLYKDIFNSKVKFPNGISDNAKDLISLAMNKNPYNRPTIQKVKEHKFFKDVKWDAVFIKEMPPPIPVAVLNKTIVVDCNELLFERIV